VTTDWLQIMDATKGELAAIRSLRRLEQKWPDTIWLYCTGNGMHVFRCGENGEHVMDNSGVPDIEACAVKLAAACPDAIDWITPNVEKSR